MRNLPNKKQEEYIKNISENILPIDYYSSRKIWESSCWDKIVKSETLLRLLITPHERHDFIMRAAVLQGLISGKSYRQIGKELWVSPQTISGIKKATEESIYKSYLERSKKKQKEEKDNSFLFQRHKTKKRAVRTKFGTTYVSF